MSDDDFPTGEYPDVTTTDGLLQAIDGFNRIRDTALAGYAELEAELDQAIRERDEARRERNDLRCELAVLRARVQWAGGAL